jgi:hypothetical protein
VGALRKPNGQFAAGWEGGPGRPRGARSRLQEYVLEAIEQEWHEHGAAVLAEVRKSKPHVWLETIVGLLPRQLHVEHGNPLSDLSDNELHEVEEMIAAARAKTVQQIEAVAIELELEDAKQHGS